MLSLNDPYIITLFNVLLFLLFIIGVFIFKKLFPKKKINLLLLLILISIVPTLSLFRPGTFEAGDIRPHTAHLLDFYYNIREGNIIPRWSGNLCAGFGCPVFIIEYTLPFYFGSLFHLIGFSALSSIKLVLASSFVASGVTMYLWAKESFGKFGGFAAGILYLFAPYHLIDLHFRGSVGEMLAFVFIPLLFLFTKKIIKTKKMIYFISIPFTILALILSHSSTTAIVLPLSLVYAVIVWYFHTKRNIKDILFYLISVIFGILISTFYWLPAIAQVNYTWWGQLGGVSFKPILSYIFSPYYFGFLYQGSDGTYTPIVGYFHTASLIIALALIFRNKIEKLNKPTIFYLALTSVVIFFMMLSVSKPIWESIPTLNTFLFAHRLLVPLSFLTAGIGGFVLSNIKNRKIFYFICFLIISTTILNWANRKMVPQLNDPFTTSDAVYTEYFENEPIYYERLNSRSKNIQGLFANRRLNEIEFISGSGNIKILNRNQEIHSYLINSTENSVIKENTFYFPGWKAIINGKEILINYEYDGLDNYGKIIFPIERGFWKVDIIYQNTSIEKVSKLISLISVIFLIIFFLHFFGKKLLTKKGNRFINN